VPGTAAWLRSWDSQGFHRTGTDGDEAGAAWLVREATALGAQVSSEAFLLDRIDPVAVYVEVDGHRIEGVPVFDAPATTAEGIAGLLGADIAVAELTPQAVYSGEFHTLRCNGSHRALVVVCRGEHPGLGLLNAEAFRDPYGAPAIHVPTDAGERLHAGGPARVVVDYRRVPAVARNVVISIAGTDRTRPPVVVMTPRSSWWRSTAERGGGLVCWLECLRALLAAPPVADVVMTANSGHELGHLGLDDFLARRPGWERDALWLHWGANLGAAGGRLSVMSSSEELRVLATSELARAGQRPDVLAPVTQVPSGETRDIHRAGGRYVTLVGTNPRSHLPQDRLPHTVDTQAVTRIAAGAAGLVQRLAGSGWPTASPDQCAV
jgi:hypothetical protein